MVYLELFNGRNSPDEQMEDWGTEGPVVGPFRFVHTMCGSNLRIDAETPLFLINGLFYYDGIYYGDWSVISADLIAGKPALAARVQAFANEKANQLSGVAV